MGVNRGCEVFVNRSRVRSRSFAQSGGRLGGVREQGVFANTFMKCLFV